MTPGGKFLVPRTILHSELWETKPAWWFKVWMYVLANANFKHHNNKLRRGDLLTSYDTVWRDCNLKKEGITAEAIDNVLRFMKKTELITTRKTTRGVIISVRNYDQLQRFEEFTNDTENDNSNEFGTTQERHYKGTKETNETTYNYLPKSKTGKEQTLGENPNLGTDTQPVSLPYKKKEVGVTTELGSVSQPKQTDPRVIFLANLKKVQRFFDKYFNSLSPERFQKEGWSSNTTACFKSIEYYLRKYKYVIGKDHVVYKIPQLKGCFANVNAVISELEELKLPPSKIDEVLARAIDRWFVTTAPEENNLRLSHFAGISKEGQASLIIDNSVYEVLDELGITDPSHPKNNPRIDLKNVAHGEDII